MTLQHFSSNTNVYLCQKNEKPMKKTMLEVFVMMLFFISFDLNAQQKKEIQLEDIWAGGTFFPEMANGVNPLNDVLSI